MKAINVRVEYLFNPLGIDIQNPRITWILDKGSYQKGFKIIYKVNDEKEKETEVIESNKMEYTFKETFKSRDHIEYKVVIIDENNKETISDTYHFEYGLLNKSDWKNAKWIKGDYKTKKKVNYKADYFKKEFNLNTTSIKKARLYITSAGNYEASINDKKVGDFVFAPGSTDYRKRYQYQTYDCTNLLNKGSNKLEIVLGNGWYRGSSGAHGLMNVYGKTTKVIALLEVTYSDNKVEVIPTNSSFSWSNDGPIGLNDLKDGERVDLNKTPSYKGKAIEVEDFEATLKSSNNFDVKELEFIKPTSIEKTGDNLYLLTFPLNIAGYVEINLEAKKGNYIKLTHGELLKKDSKRVDLTNIQCRTKKRISPLQCEVIKLKDGINIYKPKFYFGGFKYVEVETDLTNLTVDNFTAIAVYTDFKLASTFKCSNELINIFYENTIRSFKGNFLDVPTDCPTRERMAWTGDAQVFFNSAAYLVDYPAPSRKYIIDLNDSMNKRGTYLQITPHSGEDPYMVTMNGSVGWSCAGVLIPYRFYNFYHDKRILEECYPYIKRYANFMIKRMGHKGFMAKSYKINRENKKYFVNKGQSYGEWAEPYDVCHFVWTDFVAPHPEVSTAYTHYTLSKVKEIYEILGKYSEAKQLEKYVEGAKKAYQDLIHLNKEFSLDTNRQAQLVRPLYFNLLDKKDEEYAKNRLIKALDNYDWRLGTGFLSTPFILDVLTSIDPKYAFKLLLNEKMPGWLYMAKKSTSTIWENWEGVDGNENTASLNHYSKGAMVEWLFSGLLGIKVSGVNEFIVSPIFNKVIDKVEGSYDSLYGKISVKYEVKDENKLHLEVVVPPNTSATLLVKDKKETLKPGTHVFDL